MRKILLLIFILIAAERASGLESGFEAGVVFPAGYEYRFTCRGTDFSASASIAGNGGKVDGWNLTFNTGPVFLGSVVPLGIMKELTIPSICRRAGGRGGPGIRLDRSVTGSSRRGIGLSFSGGNTGLFFLEAGEDRYEGGGWIRRPGLFSPGAGFACSNPGKECDEEWISDEAPLLSERTGSLVMIFPLNFDLLMVEFLGGISVTHLDTPGGWSRLEFDVRRKYWDFFFLGGASTPECRELSGNLFKEFTSWKTGIELFPKEILGLSAEAGEIQYHLPLIPVIDREIRSFVCSSLFIRPRLFEFELYGELCHKGESSGVLVRERKAGGSIEWNPDSVRCLNIKGGSEYMLQDGDCLMFRSISGNLEGCMGTGAFHIDTELRLEIENDNPSLEWETDIEIEFDKGDYYLNCCSLWGGQDEISMMELFDRHPVFSVETGFKLLFPGSRSE